MTNARWSLSWRRLCRGLSWSITSPNFRDSPIIDRIAQVAAMMEARGWEVPSVIREVLRKAAEAGRVIGTA